MFGFPLLAHPSMGYPTKGGSEEDQKVGAAGTGPMRGQARLNTSWWAVKEYNGGMEPLSAGTARRRRLYTKADTLTEEPGPYNNPQSYYKSPQFCIVRLGGLRAGVVYDYSTFPANDPDCGEWPSTQSAPCGFSFKMTHDWQAKPPEKMVLGLTADLGQTQVSKASMHALREMDPDAVLLAGDLSYADGWFWRWDFFGAIMEPLGANYPVMVVPGDHEVWMGEQFVSFKTRYPMPGGSNMYWSRDINSAHVIAINAYTNVDGLSEQCEWVRRDAEAINRTRTPWVIVMVHTPFYNSNTAHQGEAILLQNLCERSLYDIGVDLVLAGHVHSYERMHPVLQWERNDCGPVYVNLGDGGNREGTNAEWITPQPKWSAFRENSFGVGSLRIRNSTHAEFIWQRVACENQTAPGNMQIEPDCQPGSAQGLASTTKSDSTWLVRNVASCPNKNFTGGTPFPLDVPNVASEKSLQAHAAGQRDGSSSTWMAIALVTTKLALAACSDALCVEQVFICVFAITAAGAAFFYRELRKLRLQTGHTKKDDAMIELEEQLIDSNENIHDRYSHMGEP